MEKGLLPSRVVAEGQDGKESQKTGLTDRARTRVAFLQAEKLLGYGSMAEALLTELGLGSSGDPVVPAPQELWELAALCVELQAVGQQSYVGTLRGETAGLGHWKVPAALSHHLFCGVQSRGGILVTVDIIPQPGSGQSMGELKVS